MAKKLQRMKSVILIFFLLVLLCLNSCFNSEEYSRIKKDLSDVEYQGEEIDLDSIFALMPDYEHISSEIIRTGARFNPDIILNPKQAPNFTNSKHIAFTFGMYSAGLAYVRHFERVQLCMDYMEAMSILAGNLAISHEEFNSLVPSFEDAIYDNQQIFVLTDSLLAKGAGWFSKSELHSLAALYLSGFWLESLYLGLNNIEIIEVEDVPSIENHFDVLDYINTLLSKMKDESFISDLRNSFLEIAKNSYIEPGWKEFIFTKRNKYKNPD